MEGSTAQGEALGTAPATAAAEYSFRQRFRVSAPAAFRWCIDYVPYDWSSSGGRGSRKVVWLSKRTVVLDDEFPASNDRRIRKVKLVQIYPEKKHWVSTHIVGPNHYSQFRYTILPDGAKASVLLFEGRDLRWSGEALSPTANRQLSARLRHEDSTEWKKLAVEMERDLADR